MISAATNASSQVDCSSSETAAPLRLGVLGCGRVVERYYLAALARTSAWKLAAACDIRHERREWFRGLSPRVPLFEKPEALCRSGLVDAVLVATPPETHSTLTVAALGVGLGVLVEKPMAPSVGEARAMRNAALENGAVLRVGFNRRFLRPYAALRRRAQRSASGEIRAVTCGMSFDPRGWQPISGAPRSYAAESFVLDDVASHQIDLVRWVTGLPVRRVRVSDASFCREGARIEYEIGLAGGQTASCVAAHGRRYHESLEIDLGDARLIAYRGRFVAANDATVKRRELGARLGAALDAVRRRFGTESDAATASFSAELRSFAHAVRGRRASRGADSTDGLEAAVAVAACRRGLAARGQWIALPGADEAGGDRRDGCVL